MILETAESRQHKVVLVAVNSIAEVGGHCALPIKPFLGEGLSGRGIFSEFSARSVFAGFGPGALAPVVSGSLSNILGNVKWSMGLESRL